MFTVHKWLDFTRGDLILTFTTQQEVAAYDWLTANDAPNRDPVKWTLEGSNDGSSWAVVDDKFASDAFSAPSGRYAWAGPFCLTSDGTGGAEPTCNMPPPALTLTDANDVGGCGPTLLESPTTTAASNCDRAYILGEGFADFLSTYTSAKSGPLFLLQVSTFDVCTKCRKLITFAVCLLSECARPQ